MEQLRIIEQRKTGGEMKILDLPLKKKWYQMIDAGIKTEEYREIKPYWEKRLLDYKDIVKNFMYLYLASKFLGNDHAICEEFSREYDAVRFRYGYTKRTMMFKLDNISIGKGKTEWGAPSDRVVFVLKIGDRIK